MFNISYSTWQETCGMYFSISDGSLKAYLQWFPFSKLTENDRTTIASEEFFNKYIENGMFVFYPGIMLHSENYIQKGDSSFRKSALISPLLYLVLQCLGKNIFALYQSKRPVKATAYYAGDYSENNPKYKTSYDTFFKHVNDCVDRYQYFIKTDITSFYNNINLDTLVNRVDRVCNESNVVITQNQLLLIKSLLSYCGDGKFPLIENSIISSFLSTVVYLDEVDCKLYNYISTKINEITDFEMVRYVDDMYILFSTDTPIERLNSVYNEIRNEYSSILKEYGLSLNIKKCCIKNSFEINQELKKSLYDEIYNGEKHNIEDLFSKSLSQFLCDVLSKLETDGIDSNIYNELIESHFYSPDIEFTPSEVYNYLIYENESEPKKAEVAEIISRIIECDITFLSVDPKRLSVLILKTENDKAIKAILNQLFRRDRAEIWNSYDTTVAIAYLIQRRFQHIDLLAVLKRRSPCLYDYYRYNCESSMMIVFVNEKAERFVRCAQSDTKAAFLYFMYLVKCNSGDLLEAYAYFKNFFDRMSANMAFLSGKDNCKKPNYKKYYKENAFKDLYANIPDIDKIIEKAHKLRNENPISHSSAGLIDIDSSGREIEDIIIKLNSLLDSFSLQNNL